MDDILINNSIGGGGLSGKVICYSIFEKIISLENLFLAWQEFSKGKIKKKDVLEFKSRFEENLFHLHWVLKNKTYQHSDYTAFNVYDPKLRKIHKATVTDRVLHHAIFRVLYPIFDQGFIFDSYSCRMEKGTHRAVKRLEKFTRKLSQNNKNNVFVLKCDIKKFFDSIDQEILLEIIQRKIQDEDALWLIGKIIQSFPSGLPLGNVTSQIFANIYLNELDQFVKHQLKEKYYLRYCDDFIILGEGEKHLKNLVPKISQFLEEKLQLMLHPNKISIQKNIQGIDFLGYVVFPHHRVLRTKTKKRIVKKMQKKREDLKNKKISEKAFNQSLQSYSGVLKHCKGHKIQQKLLKNPVVFI